MHSGLVFGPVIPGQLGDEKKKSSRSAGMGHLEFGPLTKARVLGTQQNWRAFGTQRQDQWPQGATESREEDFWVPYKVEEGGCPPSLPP